MKRQLAMIRAITAQPIELTPVVIAALGAVLTAQAALLLWALVRPVGPLGDWRPGRVAGLPVAQVDLLFAAADPFPATGAAPAGAALPDDLKLLGARAAVGGGRGGAIIQLADGQQVSVATGEAVAAGIVLIAVGVDHVIVDRGGQRQKLYLEEGKPAETVGAAPAATNAAGHAARIVTAPADWRSAVSFAPRLVNGAVTGVILRPGADPARFAAASLVAGDVVVSVNGVAIQSAADAAQLEASLGGGAALTLIIDRNGTRHTLSLQPQSNR